MSQNKNPGGEQWASRIGVILAVAGSAVGLGNFLRFPGQAAQNGGGAFLLPYFISLLILGIPLCWAEWTMGRYGGLKGFHSAPGIFSALWKNRLSKYFGCIALLIPLVIYMYYVLLESWCLGYAISYLNGDLMKGSDADAYSQYFSDFTGQSENGALLQPSGRWQLGLLLCTFLFNFALIYRGVSKGIETFCRIAMPIMVVLALIVLVRVLTLGTPDPSKPEQSVIGGLGFMWNPNFEALRNPQTWLAASSQIFFSLSVGFGVIINYASYLKRNDDVVLSGLTSSSMNEFFEVCLGGLITLPAAFIFLGASAGEQGTFGLGFVSLPNVFAVMPGGRFFGFLWFFMLFIAAITSSVSMLQPVIAFLEEGFGLRRHASAALLGLISALGCGFVLNFSENLLALDTFDFWVGTVLIFLLALVQAVIYGWIFGIEKGEEEAHVGAHLRIPTVVQYLLKYVVPLYLTGIFAMFCYNNVLSSSNEVGVVEASVADSLNDENAQSQLQVAFPDHVQESYTTTQGPSEEMSWQITDEEDLLKFFVGKNENGELVLFEHVPGYLEKIRTDRVVFSSVLFIALVFGFLLLMVHIAGRRWEAQGRISYDS